MTNLQYATEASPGGALVSDDSNRASSLSYATNIHGFAELRAHVPLALSEAFLRFDRAGLPHQRLSDGPEVVYEGRLEDVAISGDGMNATALGYSRAFSDSPYTALWSMVDVGAWRPLRGDEVAARKPELYQMDTNNRIQIALTKGTTYLNNADVGAMLFQKPEGGSRQIIGLSFDAIVNLPSNWQFIFDTWQSGFTGAGGALIVAGTGGSQTISKVYTFAGCDYIDLSVYNGSGVNYTETLETGVNHVTLTNVRLVTATTNMVNTTITIAQLAGNNVTCTVGSTANMYVGQRLHIGVPAALGETVIVEQILSGTQFVADFTAAAAAGVNVQAFVIYADEIVKDLVSVTNALNATQLSSSVTRIQSPAVDLFNESYEDKLPSDILTYLIGLGDNQTVPRMWEWAVWENRVLSFQPRGYAARTWYIDLSAPNIERTLNALANSVYATYQEAGGRVLRTAISADAPSIARYGVTRRKMIAVSSTSATQAGVQVAAALADDKDPIPRASITTDAIFDQNGARWPLTAVRAGDTVVERNLPPTLSTAIDRVRTFRLIRTELDLFTNMLSMEPESPLPTLDSLLARLSAGLT